MASDPSASGPSASGPSASGPSASGTDGGIRFGILGAARIAPMALVRPSRGIDAVEVTAVAARDTMRAESFAAKYAIETVHESYDALLQDSSIDAVYIPLPNGLHGRWTLAALEAGKHVLTEKPFTANAEEARAVARVWESARARNGGGPTVMEGFHYRYHPLVERMREIIASGELGPVRRLETRLCVPFLKHGDIRYRLDLAGGATMDVGCYAIHLLRTLASAGADPLRPDRANEPEVVSASAKLSSPGVDRAMSAELSFADGRTGSITCSLFSRDILSTSARVIGEEGELRVLNWTAPQVYHRIAVRTGRTRRVEHCTRRSTYSCQLTAFTAAVLEGAPVLTPPSDSIANLSVIDAIYTASGLGRREPCAP